MIVLTLKPVKYPESFRMLHSFHGNTREGARSSRFPLRRPTSCWALPPGWRTAPLHSTFIPSVWLHIHATHIKRLLHILRPGPGPTPPPLLHLLQSLVQRGCSSRPLTAQMFQMCQTPLCCEAMLLQQDGDVWTAWSSSRSKSRPWLK